MYISKQVFQPALISVESAHLDGLGLLQGTSNSWGITLQQAFLKCHGYQWQSLVETAQYLEMEPVEVWQAYCNLLGQLPVIVGNRFATIRHPSRMSDWERDHGYLSHDAVIAENVTSVLLPCGTGYRIKLSMLDKIEHVVRRKPDNPNHGYAFPYRWIYNLTTGDAWLKVIKTTVPSALEMISEAEINQYTHGIRPDGSTFPADGMVMVRDLNKSDTYQWVQAGSLQDKKGFRVNPPTVER